MECILSGVLKNYFIKSNKLLDVVMVALIISGVLSSVISIYQWLDFAKGSLWLYEVRSTRFSANLAQPNHLATLLLLSLFSCLYFFNKLKIVYILIFIPLLLFSLVLTQSRAAWLALIIIVILNILKWKEITSSVKIIIFSLIPLYMGIVNLLSRSNQSNVADRVHSGFERLAIWKDFFCVFPHLNFWGNGWKNVEYYQFQYGNNFFVYLSSYHNLLLDLLVIFGIIGGVFFIYIFINLLRIFFRIKSERDFIVFLMLFVLINHSLLEFPLFYNYFLFVFCILCFVFLFKF
ncbi:O-antigen ligase family protein [Acinetobacter terrestris]|uniref:O-antigen ligase family protein n=1 Tax=Acinetobacter terrestris TaxID=2529843 RepID=UPI00103BD5FC|nr:O-antigen ligase family protein [Acinetobacter terrestris]TCB64493.1 O-antigen ligase domain-containing protein [Acinetobacter terrestris]